MSRPLRVEYPDAWYHIMNRGSSRSKIFKERKDYDLFLKVLEESCLFFNVYIGCYCLMGNHYHLLVNTPESNLSRFMRHVNGVYTQRFNRKYKKDGSLFRGRYKGIVIQADAYLLQVVKYIHNNPLKAKIAYKLESYKHSSHRAYLKGKSNNSWLDIASVLSLFSSKRKLAIEEYKEFMRGPVDSQVEQFYSKKNRGSILGESVFREWIKQNFISKDTKGQLEIQEKRQLQGERIIQSVVREVCEMFQVNRELFFIRKRGEENIPKSFAISLSRELSGLSLPKLAEIYKTPSYKTIATIYFRLMNKLNNNKKLLKQYTKIKYLCSQEET